MTVTPQAAAVTFGTPRQLFGGRFLMDAPARGWDVSGDGQRFVLRQPRERPPEVVTHMNVVQNWLEEVTTARAPQQVKGGHTPLSWWVRNTKVLRKTTKDVRQLLRCAIYT